MNNDERDHYIDSSGLSFDEDNSDDLLIVKEYGFRLSQSADPTARSLPAEVPSISVTTMPDLAVQVPDTAPTSLVKFFNTICPGLYKMLLLLLYYTIYCLQVKLKTY